MKIQEAYRERDRAEERAGRKKLETAGKRQEAIQKAEIPKLSVSEAARVALDITTELDVHQVQELVSVLNTAEQVDRLLHETNAALTDKYVAEIEQLYAEIKKVDTSQAFYSKQLNADLNQCLSFGVNAIKKQLVLTEAQTSRAVHDSEAANPIRTHETPHEAEASVKPNVVERPNRTDNAATISRSPAGSNESKGWLKAMSSIVVAAAPAHFITGWAISSSNSLPFDPVVQMSGQLWLIYVAFPFALGYLWWKRNI